MILTHVKAENLEINSVVRLRSQTRSANRIKAESLEINSVGQLFDFAHKPRPANRIKAESLGVNSVGQRPTKQGQVRVPSPERA